MPTPEPNEGHDDFIRRCMGDEEVMSQFPDDELQRGQFCESIWQNERSDGHEWHPLRVSSGTPERRFTAMGRIALETRADDGNRITGLASVYYDGTPRTEFELGPGVVERIHPGAFKRALAGEDDVAALFNHEASQLLGRLSSGTLQLSDSDEGLRYEIDAPNNTVGRNVLESLRRRDITGSSFSFVVTEERPAREDGVIIRNVHGVRLYDVGPVTYPAYSATEAEAADRARRTRELLDWARGVHLTEVRQRANDIARELGLSPESG